MVTLSSERRAALLLREVEGLSYEQIVEVLGVSMAAVSYHLGCAQGSHNFGNPDFLAG